MYKRIIFLTLYFVVFFAPLALGSTGLWSKTILQFLFLFLLFSYFFKSLKEGVFKYRRHILNVFFISFIIAVVLQILFDTTYYTYGTRQALQILVLYCAFFFVMLNSLDDARGLDRLISVMISAGTLLSLISIFRKITNPEKIYWLINSVWPKPFPFINENHFAAYLSMIALLILGRTIYAMRKSMVIHTNIPGKISPALTIDALFSNKAPLLLFAFTISVTAIFLSASRGSIISFAIALGFFFLSILVVKHSGKAILVLLFAIFLIFLLVNWVGAEFTVKKIAATFPANKFDIGRLCVYYEGLAMLRDHPIVGIGLGAFSNLFPLYKTSFSQGGVFYSHLHNDILQFFMEMGLLSSSILVILFSMFLIRLGRMIKRTFSSYKFFIGLGILSSFFYLTLHSFLDFSMRTNAVSSLFIMLLAISILVINLEPKNGNMFIINMKTKEFTLPVDKRVKKYLRAVLFIFFIYFSYIICKPFFAYAIIKKWPTFRSFDIALKLDPKNDDLYMRYSGFVMDRYEKGYLEEDAAYDKAKGLIEKATFLNPQKTNYLVSMGSLELWQGHYDKAYDFLNDAYLREPYNPYIQMNIAYFFFWQALHEKNLRKKDYLLKKGLIYYKDSMFFRKHLYKDINLKSVIKNEKTYNDLVRKLKKEGVLVR